MLLETVTCMKGCASNTKMSCSHTKTFGKSRSEKNAITATVTGLQLSRIKHYPRTQAIHSRFCLAALEKNHAFHSGFCLTTLEKNCAFHFGFCLTTLEKNCAFHSGFCLVALEGKKKTIFLQI